MRRGHRLGDDTGVGAGVGALDDDARRRDLRVLRDGQVDDGDSAREGDDDGQHRGENRPVDEEVRKHFRPRCTLTRKREIYSVAVTLCVTKTSRGSVRGHTLPHFTQWVDAPRSPARALSFPRLATGCVAGRGGEWVFNS